MPVTEPGRSQTGCCDEHDPKAVEVRTEVTEGLVLAEGRMEGLLGAATGYGTSLAAQVWSQGCRKALVLGLREEHKVLEGYTVVDSLTAGYTEPVHCVLAAA